MNLACIISGDRHARRSTWEEIIRAELDWLRTYLHGSDRLLVIHGAQQKWNREINDFTGIDYIADLVCKADSIPVERFPADWNQYGNGAGPRRNHAMLVRLLELQRGCYRVGVLAFHDDLAHSKGTGGMVDLARSANVPVLTFTSTTKRVAAA